MSANKASPGAEGRLSQYTLHRRVNFYETDCAGIVHFSWFFRYLEEAEHARWRAAGLSIVSVQKETVALADGKATTRGSPVRSTYRMTVSGAGLSSPTGSRSPSRRPSHDHRGEAGSRRPAGAPG